MIDCQVCSPKWAVVVGRVSDLPVGSNCLITSVALTIEELLDWLVLFQVQRRRRNEYGGEQYYVTGPPPPPPAPTPGPKDGYMVAKNSIDNRVIPLQLINI